MLTNKEYQIIDREFYYLQYALEYGDDNEVTMTLQHAQSKLAGMRFSFLFFWRWVRQYGVKLESLMAAVSFDHWNRKSAIKELRQKLCK